MQNAGTVLAVSRWTEVFETSESRRYKQLTWIALPVSFNSTGLQRMLDDFDGITAAALYGCWNALLKVAATAPTRGILAGQKGESYTAGRLARLSGFPKELFEKLIDWCLTVGWLVVTQPALRLPDITEPDLTEQKQDRTGPDQTPTETGEKDTGPARTGGRFCFLNAMRTKAAAKPKILEFIEKPIEPIVDEKTPTQRCKCWHASSGWNDSLITSLADAHQKREARHQLVWWYHRQLAAPDPVIDDPTHAGLCCFLALAETAAKRPGIKNRVAWMRSQLTKQTIEEIDTERINSACKFVAEMNS